LNTAVTHILMTGAGAPGAPGIIKCLLQDASIKLTVADADTDAVGKYLHKDFVCIPKGDDPRFAEEILELCLQKKIQIILPLVTKELFSFAYHKKRFEDQGIRVLVSSEQAIETANNKSASYTFLKEKGIPVPEFFVVRTREELIHAASELGYPRKPFCFKPSVSNGGRGVRVISEVPDEAELLFHHKPYHLHMAYEQALSILSRNSFPELLVSEYLPGEEYSVDCLAERGRTLLICPRIRKRTVNGISVRGVFIRDETIIGYCTEIIEAIGLHGNIGIQLKCSGKGRPLLLEINPRVQGTIVAALGAGVNLPLLAVKKELGIEIPANEMEVKWGTGFTRYWTEVFY
jgi:carbamoyl-phosphate synthase large subunit